MIDQVDRRLKDWIASIQANVDVSLAVPGKAGKGRSVGLYLFDLIQSPPPRGTKRPPLQLALRYLVTVDDDRPEEAHRLLGELIFAAMGDPDLEVEPEPVPLGLWSAFGVSPRPAFVLRAPLRVEREQPRAKRVQVPIVVNTTAMSPLDGLVLGPGEMPIAGALVEVPSLQLFTHTDFKGRFHFAAVPAVPLGVLLRVKAKGSEVTVPSGGRERRDGGPVVVRFDRMED